MTPRRPLFQHLPLLPGLLAAVCVVPACSSEPPPEAELEVSASNLPPCELPAAAGFDDGLPGSGVDFVHRLRPVDDNSGWLPDPFSGAWGGGVVAADLDNDGQVDLFFPQEHGRDELYWGLGGARFEAASADHPLRSGDADSWQMYTNVADYDGDGLLDLLVTGLSSIRLFHNEGNRNFTEVSSELGLEAPTHYPGGAAWGDFDGDGDLDLFAGNYGLPETGSDANTTGPQVVPSRLWRNDGAQVFRDVSDNIPWQAGSYGACLQAAWRDLDRDGDLDLLQVNDFGPWKGISMLWENVGPGEGNSWNWIDRRPDSGIGVLEYPMGSAFADFDGDGLQDLWFSDVGRTRLLRGLGNWQWLDIGQVWAEQVVDEPSDVSWSVIDLDIDGDGRLEAYINYGPHQPAPTPGQDEPWADNQADRLLRSTPAADGGPRFALAEDVFASPPTGNARGTAIADLDGNGVADLVTVNLDGPPSLLLGRCTGARRLVVELRNPDSANDFGIGAKVQVEAGSLIQEQEMAAGSRGSFSGSHPRLYFGLGDAASVDRLTVRWPNGDVDSVSNLCSHCSVLLSPSQSL